MDLRQFNCMIDCMQLINHNIIVHQLNILAMDSAKQATHKYNKVNQQKKFHLLNLIYKQKVPIRQAARIVAINYLTAKTIVFFHKNNYKSYQFDLQSGQTKSTLNIPTASFVPVRKTNAVSEKLIRPKSRIEVICSIGNILSPCTQPKCPMGELTGQPTIKEKQLHFPLGWSQNGWNNPSTIFHSQQLNLPMEYSDIIEEPQNSTDQIK